MRAMTRAASDSACAIYSTTNGRMHESSHGAWGMTSIRTETPFGVGAHALAGNDGWRTVMTPPNGAASSPMGRRLQRIALGMAKAQRCTGDADAALMSVRRRCAGARACMWRASIPCGATDGTIRSSPMERRALSLFSGAGGMDLGVTRAGCAMIDPYACETLHARHGGDPCGYSLHRPA